MLDFKEIHLPEILEIVRPNSPVIIENRILIDSLEMTDDTRLQVIDSCKISSEKKIIITHGMDTMNRTAVFLGKAMMKESQDTHTQNIKKLSDKTIMLTGALYRNECNCFFLGLCEEKIKRWAGLMR